MINIFVNPSKFNDFSDMLIKPLFVLSLLTLFIGLIFVFYLSPEDYQQGSTVRIMYVHVPSAWISMLTFFIMTIYSIVALVFKAPFGCRSWYLPERLPARNFPVAATRPSESKSLKPPCGNPFFACPVNLVVPLE